MGHLHRARGYGLEADISFDEVHVADYEAILCSGGRAPEYLRNNERLLDIVREFDAGRSGSSRFATACRSWPPPGW